MKLEMGLVWDKKSRRFMWGWEHGWGRGLPSWVTHVIINVVNPVCCRMWGHRFFPDFDDVRIESDGHVHEEDMVWDVCLSCSKRRKHNDSWKAGFEERLHDHS